jgi:hypothetical protein
MKSRKVSPFKNAFEIAIRFVKDDRAESGRKVAPGRAARLIPDRKDLPHHGTFLLIRARPVLGCHHRLLSKLLS